MTDPREEIKRLADESETAMANLCCNEIMRLDKVLKAKWQEARVALHAAIDAISQASSACPVCGQGTPHSHSEGALVHWLRAQVSRFIPDWEKVIVIRLGDEHDRDKQRIKQLEQKLEDYEDNDRKRMYDHLADIGFWKGESHER